MALTNPESHNDLIAGPVRAALITVMADGQPQTTVVWRNTDGTHVLINTMNKFQKAKNMQRNPKVTLFVYRRDNPLRYIEVDGTVVEMTKEGAMEHTDELAELDRCNSQLNHIMQHQNPCDHHCSDRFWESRC